MEKMEPLEMADLKRWFKVYTSLLIDMDDVSDDIIGKWTRLGCRIASVGNSGTVIFTSKEHAARFFGVTVPQLHNVLQAIPGVQYSISTEEGKSVDGTVAVTMRKWHSYQEDSTAGQRMKTLRAKRRGDESRRDKSITAGDIVTESVTAPPPKKHYQKPNPSPAIATPPTQIPHYPEPEPGTYEHGLESIKDILAKAKPIPPPAPRAPYVPKEPHWKPDEKPEDKPEDDPWA